MKKIIMMVVFCLFFMGNGNITYAESGVKVTNANNEVKLYEEQIQSITFDNKKMDINTTPGVVIDNEVMLPHTAVFEKILGMQVAYEEKSGTVVLKTKEHTMQFQINSKTAILDGKQNTLSVAPVKAEYINTKVQTVLLPIKAIAQAWDYEYEYDASSNNVLLDRGDGIALVYGGLPYYYQGKPVELFINDEKIKTQISAFSIEDQTMIPIRKMAKEIGADYYYSSTNKTITISYQGNEIIMTMKSKTAKINGEKVTLPIAPVYIKNKSTGIGANMVPGEFLAEELEFTYEVQDDRINFTISEEEESEQSDYNSQSNSTTESIKGYQVAIPLKTECRNGKYEVEDDYFNHQFKITLNGSYESYYKSKSITNTSSSIKSISVKQSSGNTIITLKSNKIMGYRIQEKSGILYIKVGTPKSIYDKIVVLDAGHGGTDPGAAGNGIYEKNCTLNIVNAAKEYFDSDGSVKVYYTRTSNTQANMTSGSNGLNTSTSLGARTTLANEVEADLFISVHINSASNTSARGTEVYYCSGNNRKNSGGLTASKLASIAYDDMVNAVGSSKRGVKTANFYVVKYTKMPAILIETAFISNKQDASILKNSKKIDQMGKAVYDTVNTAFSQYPTRR